MYSHIQLASKLSSGCDYALFKVSPDSLFKVSPDSRLLRCHRSAFLRDGVGLPICGNAIQKLRVSDRSYTYGTVKSLEEERGEGGTRKESGLWPGPELGTCISIALGHFLSMSRPIPEGADPAAVCYRALTSVFKDFPRRPVPSLGCLPFHTLGLPQRLP